jgi:hypothetical protein
MDHDHDQCQASNSNSNSNSMATTITTTMHSMNSNTSHESHASYSSSIANVIQFYNKQLAKNIIQQKNSNNESIPTLTLTTHNNLKKLVSNIKELLLRNLNSSIDIHHEFYKISVLPLLALSRNLCAVKFCSDTSSTSNVLLNTGQEEI